jgi:type IV pilus assembly protein PilP
MKTRLLFFVMSALALLTLAGCEGAGSSDLRQWMSQQENQPAPRVPPLAPPAPYVPLPYTEARAEDPFSIDRLMRGLMPAGEKDTSLSKQCEHRKEPLESIPLDTMTMVGSLDRAGIKVALVRVDKLLYQVRMGNYLGQNCGLVKNISENQVTLSEVIRDGTGGWIERPAALQLQEKTK